MKRFFTNFILTIAAFSLFIGVTSVAYGVEAGQLIQEPTEVSGVCSVRNAFVNAPTFYLPDVGVGYAKKTNPGINTISELRQVCTEKVYQELLRQYCKQNTEPPQRGVITYNETGKINSTAGSAFGSGYVYCPSKEIPAISFPIPELGNCGNKEECRDYCEDLKHARACTGYGRENDLLDEEEGKTLEEFSDVIENGGPGGCKTEESCGAYCEDTANLKECLGFVKKHNLLTDDEIKEVEKAVEVIENGGPGGCTKEEDCRIYCEDIDNIEECVKFADKFDLVTSDELEEMRKMADVKKAGTAFPGNCKTKESCMKYCDNSTHAAECMEFALNAGFIPKEDVEAVSKILPYLKSGGTMPGGCTTKEVCDYYCESDAHASECADFAVGAGFMTKEEAEMMKRTGGKSPGNCRSKEACESYCKDEKHIDECMDFAVKAGFMSKEDAENAKKFKITSGPGGCTGRAECEAFCVVNQEECFNWAKEHGMDAQMGLGPEECAKQGGNWDGKMCEMGAVECVKQGGSVDGTECVFPEGQFPGIECENPPCGPPGESNIPTEGLGGPQQGFSGPGGCKTPDECKAYCMSNPQACQGSAPPPNFDNAAAECSKQGGNWINDNCSFPPPPSIEYFGPPIGDFGPKSGEPQPQYPLLMQHPFLGAVLRYLFK